MQFNLGIQSLGAEKQAGKKWEEGSQTGTQAKKHEKQTAGAGNVQAGGKCWERETRRQTGAMKLEQSGKQ